MPTLTVADVGVFEVPANKRLVLALEEDAGIDQLHACGGRARCTTCRVEFVSGEPDRMTVAERTALAARGLTGVRLSCQSLCDQDMTVRAISRLAGSGRADAGPKPQPFIEPPPEYLMRRRAQGARKSPEQPALSTEHRAQRDAPIPPVIDPALLVRAYREGHFPMALEDGEIGWFSPDPRGVIPIETFHVPSRLARTIRRQVFDLRVDHAFDAVISACAADREDGTWISDEIIESYAALHRLGLAHSVEVWQGETLVGGLYGVSLGGVFFGESMFHRVPDASKVALAVLVDRLARRGFTLLDIQWVTAHLEQFGAIEISRAEYLRRLRAALPRDCRF